VVHDTEQAVAGLTDRLRRRLGLLIVCAGSAVALITGCGSGSGTQPQIDVGPNVGAPISLADCNDWNQADTAQRLGTIQQLKDFAGGQVVGNSAADPSGTGSVLGDKQAYDLLDNYCKNNFARGFKLYRLYTRATAFAGHAPQ
jgi:hypothetical protein